MSISRKKIYIVTLILYLVCLPLNAMNLGNLGSVLKIIAIIPIIVGFSNLKIRFNNLLKWQTYFTFLAIVSMVWSVSKENSIGRIISYIELLALLFSGSCFDFSLGELKKIKLGLVWSSRITAVLLIRYGEIFAGRLWLKDVISEDPNYLCAYFSFGVVFALQKIIENKSLKKKLLGIAEIVVYIYLVFMTGSRGGLIAIAACIVSYLLVLLGKSNLKKSIGIIIAFLIVIFIGTSLVEYLPTQLRDRFTIADIQRDGGSGRVEIWENGLDLYKSSSVFRWIFGYGTATIRYCFGYFGYSRVNVMHNMFLETLLELGLIGLIIYCITIFKFFKSSLKIKNYFTFAVLTGMVVMSLSTSIYTFKPYFNIMLFTILCSNYYQKYKDVDKS